MYNFSFLKSLGGVAGKLGELIEDFEQNNDVRSDAFNAVQLDRLVAAKDLVVKTRDAFIEASVDD